MRNIYFCIPLLLYCPAAMSQPDCPTGYIPSKGYHYIEHWKHPVPVPNRPMKWYLVAGIGRGDDIKLYPCQYIGGERVNESPKYICGDRYNDAEFIIYYTRSDGHKNSLLYETQNGMKVEFKQACWSNSDYQNSIDPPAGYRLYGCRGDRTQVYTRARITKRGWFDSRTREVYREVNYHVLLKSKHTNKRIYARETKRYIASCNKVEI